MNKLVCIKKNLNNNLNKNIISFQKINLQLCDLISNDCTFTFFKFINYYKLNSCQHC